MSMTDQQRHHIAEQFAADWLVRDDDDPADLHGYPRLACDRVLFVMALTALLESVEQRTQQAASGGVLMDLDRVVAMCVGDHTT